MHAAAPIVTLLCFATVLLALNVSRERIVHRVPHGDGPAHELARSIRAHMNSVEHLVPLGFLFLVAGMLEVNGTAVVALGVAALVARLLITIGILVKGRFALRRYGAWSTYAIEVALVGLCGYASLR